MKKKINFLVAFILTATLLGCNNTNNPTSGTSTSPAPTTTSPSETSTITIAEAIEIATQAGSTLTTEKYLISGTIESVSNSEYGNMTVKDETGSLFIYGTWNSDGTLKYGQMSDKPVAGDSVTILGALKSYEGKPEMEDGWIIDFTHNEPDVNLNEYREVLIVDARGKNEGKFKLTGVVAFITYAFGFNPNGFYLVDNTSSIYVYGSQVAQQVEVGNKVTIAGERVNFIAENEATNAAKHNYKGAIQIANPYLLENDNGNNEWNKNWVGKSTVKNLLENKNGFNFTSDIWKVDALVKKVPGNGFVNYYINDIDGVTGSYVYTACNGSDFEYLDEFDGKICTVYLSIINYKSTASDLIARFIPILVKDENYSFDLSKSTEYALDYHAKDQFLDVYQADPALEVITLVKNELIGVDNVTISYESKDTNIAYFETTIEGKVIFHTNEPGTVEISISAKYENTTRTTIKTIKVEDTPEVVSITVAEALATENGTKVIVKGVVASSLVNHTGFYLIDETGAIAVSTTADVLSQLAIGNEVAIEGTKNIYETTNAGVCDQHVIRDATLVVNYMGNHEYSTASFEEKSIEDLITMSKNPSTYNTLKVYKTKAKVCFVDMTRYSNYYITTENGTSEDGILLYTSSGSQYNFLLENVRDQYIEMEVALCDWNNKSTHRACILSIIVNGEKLVNNLNFIY